MRLVRRPAHQTLQRSLTAPIVTDLIIVLLIASGMTLVGLLLFSSTGHDDAHITEWAAYSLARFGEILNYNGQRFEQSSSLSR